MSGSGILKAPTGIAGLDAITRGGLPKGRVTLVEGQPGAGKTVLALQTLVHGIRECGEPGIFVAFEESPGRIIANAYEFGWDLPSLLDSELYFLNAQPTSSLIQSGAFDLDGMLAMIGAKVSEMGAQRIVFDALDVVLGLMDDPEAVRRELYRVHDWLLERELTTIITHKAAWSGSTEKIERYDYIQFMVDAAITLRHDVVDGYSQRVLRVLKYRGSGFDENEAPTVIGPRGLVVAAIDSEGRDALSAPTELVSTGIDGLDAMLNGGYFRAASVLLTGAPGTAKTTLCGAFAEAACRRGEPTLFVAFGTTGGEVVRNLQSVGIDLSPCLEQGLLHFLAPRSIQGSAESHLLRIKLAAEACQPRCIVVDPVSALSKSADMHRTISAIERLVDWAKRRNITLVCTSLLNTVHSEAEGTLLRISTIADTWIHLSYKAHAGERNRALNIVKSRGTGHSNQVRELLLSDDGLTLVDVYIAGGEVLMGTLRYEKERSDREAKRVAAVKAERRRQQLSAEAASLEWQLEALERERAETLAEQADFESAENDKLEESRATQDHVRKRRSGRADEGHGMT